jgi:hypothetical protein
LIHRYYVFGLALNYIWALKPINRFKDLKQSTTPPQSGRGMLVL